MPDGQCGWGGESCHPQVSTPEWTPSAVHLPWAVPCAVPLAKLLAGGACTGYGHPLLPEEPPYGGGGYFPLHCHLPAVASLSLLPAHPIDPLLLVCRGGGEWGAKDKWEKGGHSGDD